MKKLFSGATLVVLLSLTLSLFVTNQVQSQENNGTIVEIVKGNTWILTDDCGGEFYTDETSFQLKDGETHIGMLVWTIPKDSCIIKDYAYIEYWGPWRVLINPSGKVIAKYVSNWY